MDAADRQAASHRRLLALGWGEMASAFARLADVPAGAGSAADPGVEPGRVVAIHRGVSIVRTADGDLPARLSGRLRRAARDPAGYPAVGDWVAVQRSPDGATIQSVLPRRGVMIRTAADAVRRTGRGSQDRQVLAANVDVALLVDSLQPGPNLRRLERYLALAWSSGARPVVILNKADLLADAGSADGASQAADEALRVVGRIAPGVTVLLISALTGAGMGAIEATIGKARTAVVVGPSGVGKSTIVNSLLGDERQATGSIRLDDGRGRHTTTTRELFALPWGGLIIDTPGIRSLELAADEEALELAFSDVTALAEACRFSDCRHEDEPGCALRAAVDDGRLSAGRLMNALKLQAEARRREEAATRDAREQKRQGRTLSRAIRQHYRLRDREPG